MALNDFFEIKDFQVMFGKPILNVYHVKRIDATAKSEDIKQAFINHIVEDHLVLMQSAVLLRTEIQVRNLGDVTDFLTTDSSTLPGQAVGQTLPSFNAATLQFNRTRNDMKNGSKRICAGGETESTNGTWIAGFITTLTALLNDLLVPWVTDAAPAVDVCSLAVLKRFCKVPAQDPCLGYRLPETDAEVDNNHYIPVTGLVKDNVRSQVSRKIL